MSYQNLEVWKLAKELTAEIHEMSMHLPDFEKYEEGHQIRRSIKSVRSTLVEGYGRRRYKADYVKFITYALSLNDETLDHLEILFETKSLKDEKLYLQLKTKVEILGKKLNNFLKAVQSSHQPPEYLNEVNEPSSVYAEEELTHEHINSEIQTQLSTFKHLESSIQNPEPNPWQTLSKEEKYDNKWINVTEYKVLNPARKPGIYGKVHFKNKAIGIIPIDYEGNTWLVGQWRFTLNEWSWEIVEGGGPLETDILESAQRELKEETGLAAKKWTLIQRTHLSNSVSDEEGFIFLAEEISHGENELEDTEADLKVWKLPFAKALQMVLDGEITDSLSVTGLLKASRILNY